jgi:hypothetical protein
MQIIPSVPLVFRKWNIWVILYLTRALKWTPIKDYGRIATPLKTLLKKDAFSWTQEVTQDFEKLKEVMCRTLILATHDFTIFFIVECDALELGIGAVLMQNINPIAFENHELKGRDLLNYINDKEMLAILHAVKKHWIYLIGRGRHFKVKMYNDSLRCFLQQRISSVEQQKWVTKILGLHFEIIYKKGKQNVVADAVEENSEVFVLFPFYRLIGWKR